LIYHNHFPYYLPSGSQDITAILFKGRVNIMTVSIKEVSSKKDIETFIRLPWSIYRDDPAWVPPLLLERREFLNPSKNPFF
jgi:hypothetical protein